MGKSFLSVAQSVEGGAILGEVTSAVMTGGDEGVKPQRRDGRSEATQQSKKPHLENRRDAKDAEKQNR